MTSTIQIQNTSTSYLPNFSEIISYTQDKISFIAKSTFSDPIFIGFTTAVSAFPYQVAIAIGLEMFGLGDVWTNAEIADVYIKEVGLDPFNVIVEAPIIEEFLFRGAIQTVFTHLAKQILPNSDIEVFSIQIKLSALVSIVATSILFGLAHLSNGTGLIQFVSTTLAGLLLGYLKCEYGIASSIAAHMTHNALAWSLISLSNLPD